MPFTESQEHGLLITRVRRYNLVVNVLFGGRRGRLDRILVRAGGAAPGERVVDVGCGPGRLARRLAAAVGPRGEVVGVDPSEPMVAHAAERAKALPWCRFVVAPAQSLDLPDGGYDLVTSTFAMHHIAEEGRGQALAEMYRVLRPGGRLLIADARISGRVAPKALGAFTRLSRLAHRGGHGHGGHGHGGHGHGGHGHGHGGHGGAGSPMEGETDVRRYADAIAEAGFTELAFTDVRPFTRYVTAVKPR